MFGAKPKSAIAKLIHINFSTQLVTEHNFQSLKEYCHITFDQDGWIQHLVVDAASVSYVSTEDYTETMVSVNAGSFSGIKGVQILIPKNCSLNSL